MTGRGLGHQRVGPLGTKAGAFRRGIAGTCRYESTGRRRHGHISVAVRVDELISGLLRTRSVKLRLGYRGATTPNRVLLWQIPRLGDPVNWWRFD